MDGASLVGGTCTNKTRRNMGDEGIYALEGNRVKRTSGHGQDSTGVKEN